MLLFHLSVIFFPVFITCVASKDILTERDCHDEAASRLSAGDEALPGKGRRSFLPYI